MVHVHATCARVGLYVVAAASRARGDEDGGSIGTTVAVSIVAAATTSRGTYCKADATAALTSETVSRVLMSVRVRHPKIFDG